MIKMATHWTEKELTILKRKIKNTPLLVISIMLNSDRTVPAITKKAKQLNLWNVRYRNRQKNRYRFRVNR